MKGIPAEVKISGYATHHSYNANIDTCDKCDKLWDNHWQYAVGMEEDPPFDSEIDLGEYAMVWKCQECGHIQWHHVGICAVGMILRNRRRGVKWKGQRQFMMG